MIVEEKLALKVVTDSSLPHKSKQANSLSLGQQKKAAMGKGTVPIFHYLYGKVRDLLLVLFCNFLPNSLIFDQDGEDRLDAGPTVDGYVRQKNRHEWGE